MQILQNLKQRWEEVEKPFLIHNDRSLSFNEIINQTSIDLSQIKDGDVVALVGDFDPQTILTLLLLIDKKAIIAPLTKETKSQHEYFFKSAIVDIVIENNQIRRIKNNNQHKLIEKLRANNNPGLILFSTGTTGHPKAILHDLTLFIKRFETPRPTLKTINFLLFDHIGGLNTLLHTLFNKGTIISTKSRSVERILDKCNKHNVEVLPTTPTFLRMMLMSGLVPKNVPNSLKIITYGTERMDQPTLDLLCKHLPNIDFRQTFGMSELGIVRVKSKARNSLFMKIGGEGVETRVIKGVLEIRSASRMLGYLNADSPFDKDGWYCTKDVVEKNGDYYMITGRTSETINVGGLKFMASEVERIVLQFEGIELAKVESKTNPITGQHVELIVQPTNDTILKKSKLRSYLSENLPSHMTPKRIKISEVSIGHRFKKGN
jgi:long-chain acyl-CoA synthetase